MLRYSCRVTIASAPAAPGAVLRPLQEGDGRLLVGRDAICHDLAHAVTGAGFRAGLVFGPCGVGKTSLLAAGLVPRLREQAVVAIRCADPLRPTASVATALHRSGFVAGSDESAAAFVTRVVMSQPGLFVFIVDDAEIACRDEHAVSELADLFSRVVTRASGRVRFLFACDSSHLHELGQLENRTGSLFAPGHRYPLVGVTVAEAELALGGQESPSRHALAASLAHDGVVLPADLHIAALAASALGIESCVHLSQRGGLLAVEHAWLHQVAAASRHPRGCLRVVATLATATSSMPAAALAQDSGLDEALVESILQHLGEAGIVAHGADGAAIQHPLLKGHLREVTAAVRSTVVAARALLAERAGGGGYLRLHELWTLRRDQIHSQDQTDRQVFSRSLHRLQLRGAAAASALVAMLTLGYCSNHGKVYLAISDDEASPRITVRAGRPGWSAFHWMPSSPGFGELVGDTGLSRWLVAPEAWKDILANRPVMSADTWPSELTQLMEPRLAAVSEYASSGDDKALAALIKLHKKPDEITELLLLLEPIAAGSAAEVAFVDACLKSSSTAVQRAALALAGSAAQRGTQSYADALIQALTGSDSELRRIAIVAVRGFPVDSARTLLSAALSRNPEPAVRRTLLVEIATPTADSAPSAATAVSFLSDPDATPEMKQRARSQLRRQLVDDPATTVKALAEIIPQERTPSEARIFALTVLAEARSLPKDGPDLAAIAHTAFSSRSESIRTAALPLYARVDPTRAAGDLAEISRDKKVGRPMRQAAALGWGALVPSYRDAADVALGELLKDTDPAVRATAARAYGKLGRPSQDALIKLIRLERFDVAIGAAEGLAITAEVGASAAVAVSGIAQLWNMKGRMRREAARIFAQLAATKPGEVMNYLAASARHAEDPGLHAIGVEGLCNAATAGSAEARHNLLRACDHPSTDLRRQIIACVADGPEPATNGLKIATRLVHDPDAAIRMQAARILASSTRPNKKLSEGTQQALVGLLEDPSRDVRLIAAAALGTLESAAPATAAAAIARVFDKADDDEKLSLLRAAQSLGSTEVIVQAANDSSPLVRMHAIEAAFRATTRGPDILASALSDSSAQVRQAALESIATHKDKLDPAQLEKALSLAVRDSDGALASTALLTLAKVGAK
jgi:HEAT repeat protein